MTRIASFDVFDTVLLRRVAVPSDVFRMMGARISREIHSPIQYRFVEDFLSARLHAEKLALRHTEECTLEQIWGHLHELLPDLPAGYGPEH
ncbi:MAG TPA: hypothetical protein VLK33_01680, partial [Terriglobales bacterium]|nr:hypothetical protein [Terriglobales bacterium]